MLDSSSEELGREIERYLKNRSEAGGTQQSTMPVYQEHTGNGNNNLSIVYQELGLSSLLVNLYRHVRYGYPSDNDNILQLFQSPGSKVDQEVVKLIEIGFRLLNRTHTTTDKSDLIDLRASAQENRHQFQFATALLYFIKALFSEDVDRIPLLPLSDFGLDKQEYLASHASAEEVTEVVENLDSYPSEPMLISLITGLIRVRSTEKLDDIMKMLLDRRDCPEHQSLRLLAKMAQLNAQHPFYEKPQWSRLSRSAQEAINKWVKELLSLPNKEGLFQRDLVLILADITQFLDTVDNQVIDYLGFHKDYLGSQKHPVAKLLENISSGQNLNEQSDNVDSIVAQAETNRHIDDKAARVLIFNAPFDTLKSLAQHEVAIDGYESWLSKLHWLIGLMESSVGGEGDTDVVEDLCSQVLEDEEFDPTQLSEAAVSQLIERLRLKFGLHQYVVMFLNGYYQDCTPGFSQLLHHYLLSLAETDQLATFDRVLTSLQQQGYSKEIGYYRLILNERLREYEQGLEYALELLRLSENESVSNRTALYDYALKFALLAKVDEERLGQLIDLLPDDLLLDLNNNSKILADRICFAGGFDAIWGYMVDWFLSAPHDASGVIEDCFVAQLARYNFPASKFTKCRLPSPGPYLVVEYEQGGIPKSALITSCIDTKHERIINSSHPAINALVNSEVGEDVYGALGHIKVTERKPVYPGLLHIASEMRPHSDNRRGWSIKLPDSASNGEMLKVLHGFMASHSVSQPVDLESDKLPLTLKLQALQGGCFTDKACSGLFSPDVTMHPLPTKGETTGKEIFVDVPTVVYLCFLSLVESAMSKFSLCITEEVEEELSSWIDEMQHGNFVGKARPENGEVKLIEKEELNAALAPLINQLNDFLRIARVKKLKAVDLPHELSRLGGAIDASTSSTMKTAYSRSGRYCTVDPALNLIYQQAGGLVADTATIVLESLEGANEDSLNMLFEGYCHHNIQAPINLIHISRYTVSPTETKIRNIQRLIEKTNVMDGRADVDNLKLIGDIIVAVFNNVARSYYQDSLLVSAFKELLFTSIDVFLKKTSSSSAETRLAHLLVYVCLSQLSHTRRTVITNLFMAFVDGHFMDAEAFKNSIEGSVKRLKLPNA